MPAPQTADRLIYVTSKDGERFAALPDIKAITHHVLHGNFGFCNEPCIERDGTRDRYTVLSKAEGLAWIVNERSIRREQVRQHVNAAMGRAPVQADRIAA